VNDHPESSFEIHLNYSDLARFEPELQKKFKAIIDKDGNIHLGELTADELLLLRSKGVIGPDISDFLDKKRDLEQQENLSISVIT
jgi:hypothetical protein